MTPRLIFNVRQPIADSHAIGHLYSPVSDSLRLHPKIQLASVYTHHHCITFCHLILASLKAPFRSHGASLTSAPIILPHLFTLQLVPGYMSLHTTQRIMTLYHIMRDVTDKCITA